MTFAIFEMFNSALKHHQNIFNFVDVKWGQGRAKKKRKQDPSQLKAKEEKRRRRLAKALRKMEKKDRLPKTLVECEVPIVLHQERSERLRNIVVTDEENERRILHMKDWARHCYTRLIHNMYYI